MAAGTGVQPRRPTRRAAVLALGLVAIVAACSSDDGDGGRPQAAADTTVVQVDASALVDLGDVEVEPVPEGGGVANLSASAPDAEQPLPRGYVESEHLLSGSAAVYAGDVAGPVTVESNDHGFVTRMLVRAPVEAADFSGTVWVEPFNTTGGPEADVIWGALAPLIESRGDAWVGVTVRSGQQALLQEFDAVRYAGLDLSENAFTWDIIRDVGALLKTNAPVSPIAALGAEQVYLGGYSQSAVDTSTFVTAFHDTTRLDDGAAVFDGYFIGARESNLTPLQSGDTIIPQFEHGPLPATEVPVVNIEPQTDVEGFAVEVPTELARQEGVAGAEEIDTPTFTYVNVGGAGVRRPDSDAEDDRYRLFEIPGAPHSRNKDECDGVTTFPTRAFVRAAAAQLAGWAEEGEVPPEAPRIELATLDDVSVTSNDEHGNALGGVRSPFVDVPLSTFAVHTGPGPICILSGDETPLDGDVLDQLYGDVDSYLEAFTAALDETIEAGFLLEIDREEILDTQTAWASEVFAGG